MKEKLRITLLEMEECPQCDLILFCLGKDILNNPNIIRQDDITNGDVVFYEKSPSQPLITERKYNELAPNNNPVSKLMLCGAVLGV